MVKTGKRMGKKQIIKIIQGIIAVSSFIFFLALTLNLLQGTL